MLTLRLLPSADFRSRFLGHRNITVAFHSPFWLLDSTVMDLSEWRARSTVFESARVGRDSTKKGRTNTTKTLLPRIAGYRVIIVISGGHAAIKKRAVLTTSHIRWDTFADTDAASSYRFYASRSKKKITKRHCLFHWRSLKQETCCFGSDCVLWPGKVYILSRRCKVSPSNDESVQRVSPVSDNSTKI